jgi:hypothetical protein
MSPVGMRTTCQTRWQTGQILMTEGASRCQPGTNEAT